MKLLLVYPPFCPPSMPPYSISSLKSFLTDNLKINVKCLDLNAKFHQLKFPEYYQSIRLKKYNQDIKQYGNILAHFENASRPVYAENNRKIINKQFPEFYQEILKLILQEKPNIVAFSFVYNSQCFYATPLLQELKKCNISCIVGGPATITKFKEEYIHLKNEVEFLNYLTKIYKITKKYKKENYFCHNNPDFQDYKKSYYLSKELIIPLKTSSTCFYKQCTFCTHYLPIPYYEFSLEEIKSTIQKSKARHVFFIDDMISKKRLEDLAEILKPLKINWLCQLRPTADIIPLLPTLKASGLHAVLWGVESANQRILNLIKKGTTIDDIKKALQSSQNNNIKNLLFIMFGFPTETKEEIMNTFQFLKDNEQNIDLICTSIFGLQKQSYIYNNPQEFFITNIHKQPRTVLEEKITYTLSQGVSQEEAKKIRKRHMHIINKINKVPKVFDYLKEQILLFD